MAAKRAALTALCLAATVCFLALGAWQVQRRAWKLDLIERVEARIQAPPAALPASARWGDVDEQRDGYRRVSARGTFIHECETRVQALTELGGGFWILTPLRTPDGIVFVNRGFVPKSRESPASRKEAQAEGPVAVAGLLRMSEPGGGFLRANDPAAGRWYSRDVEAMGAQCGLHGVAPFFIDADATPNPGGYPLGGLTVVAFRNNHLVYALTWFALAAMSAFGVWLLMRRKGR